MKFLLLSVLIFLSFLGCHADQRGRSRTVQESKERGVYITALETDWVIAVDTLIPRTNELVFFIEEQYCYGWNYKKSKNCKKYFSERNGIQITYGTINLCDSYKKLGSKCESDETLNDCRTIPVELRGKVSDFTERAETSVCQNFSINPPNNHLHLDKITTFDTTLRYVIQSYTYDSIGYVDVYIPNEDELFKNR